MLPGWSGNNDPAREWVKVIPCSYKGCKEPAVYRDLPGSKKVACKMHGDKIIERQRKRNEQRYGGNR